MALLVPILAVALAGCSGDDNGDNAGASASARPSGSGAGAPAPSSAAAPGGTAAPDLPVLTGRDGTVKELSVRVELNELRVEGRVTRLTFTARNLEQLVPGETPKRWQIAAFFNDGINQKQNAASPDDAFSVDGVYLLDRAGARRYLAARNATQGCVCSNDLNGTFVSPNSGVVLTTLFAALPAGVDAVDVVVPGFGPFNEVKVSR